MIEEFRLLDNPLLRTAVRFCAAISLPRICAIALPTSAQALVVTTTNDRGAGSLRDAINNARDGNTITFNIPTTDPGYNSSTGVYTRGQLEIAKNLTIGGPVTNHLTVQRSFVAATQNFGIFAIVFGSRSGRPSVSLSGLTLTNGTPAKTAAIAWTSVKGTQQR